MTDSDFNDYFSHGSPDYQRFRPRYPAELVQRLSLLCPKRDRAWDCGCGSGQLSVPLAAEFNEVVATDASATQIQQAPKVQNIVFQLALAEKSELPSCSIDLVTVAQSAHWFNLDRFYDEVRRVSRPHAVLALITYGVLHVDGVADQPIQRFYHDIVGPYWPPERRHVEDGYQSLAFPFQEIDFPTIVMEEEWQLAQLLGYLSTWSATKEARRSLGKDILHELEQSLRRDWTDPSQPRRIRWPLRARVGWVKR